MELAWLVAVMTVVTLGRVAALDTEEEYTEESGRSFMDRLDNDMTTWGNRMAVAQWNYDSNLTDYNLQIKMNVSSAYADYYKEQWKEIIKYPWKTFEDPFLKREFKFYSKLGTAALPEERRARLDKIVAEMLDIYSTMKLWEWREPGSKRRAKNEEPTVSLDPDVEEFFTKYINDSCKLQYYWEGWFGSVGREEKPLFEEYVKLSNEAAKLNNYTDNAAYWNEEFEMDDFDEACHKLYDQILPLYEQLHAYVRRKLSRHHNRKRRKLIQRHGCLPAHILGNVWAQNWQHVYNLTAPYPDKTSLDITPIMKEKKYTPLQLFEISEEFYTSLNMSAMTKTFWERSIIEKPTDRELVCHASAWDFDDGDDFRIKMCTQVSREDFTTIHHEMGHIEYYMQYKDQRKAFRCGANSGFHEAVGDTIALSVSTPKHLIKIGLLDNKTYVEDMETEINTLYTMALEKVAFLPFAYVLDLWRWEVFRGNITANEYNCRYWQLRQELEGIVPPVPRGVKDFDAGAKYHVIADVPYIRYFVSFIIQFQFYKALCIKAGQYDPNDPASKPLHQCDIYQSKEAGNLFSEMLRMGSSKPWQDAMEVLTGQREMDSGPLMEYFQPLYEWLVKENKRAKAHIGWSNEPKIDCSNKGRVKSVFLEKDEDKNCRYIFPRKKSKNDDSNEE